MHGSFELVGSDLTDAQADMRFAYYGGAAGLFASALVWLCAAIVSAYKSPIHGIWTLLIGGMLIHPACMLIARLLGRPGSHSKGNPLGPLGIASTFWLIFSLPLAYAASLLRIEWFFPAMLLVIGGRYLVFHTLYGLRIYWSCGLALAASGLVSGIFIFHPTLSAVMGASIEAAFGVAILMMSRHDKRPDHSFKQNTRNSTSQFEHHATREESP